MVKDARALAQVLRQTVLAMVRQDGPDLTARQLGVLLTVYLTEGPHTVRGLAAELHVSKPAISRALDRLGELGLVRWATDPADARGVLAKQTAAERALLSELERTLTTAAEDGIQATV